MKSKFLKIFLGFLIGGLFLLANPTKALACPYGDLACGKSASGNSLWVWWPQKAVDGVYNSDWYDQYAGSDESSVYQIDLGASYPINLVRVLSAMNTYGARGSGGTRMTMEFCLSATSAYWTNNYCVAYDVNGTTISQQDWNYGQAVASANPLSAYMSDGQWYPVAIPNQNYRWVTVFIYRANGFFGQGCSTSVGGCRPDYWEVEVYPPPPTCSISGTTSPSICSASSYSATTYAGSGDYVTGTGIYATPHGTQNWPIGSSGGNPYGYSFTFPSSGSWDVVCNGYDSLYRCTGNPAAANNYPDWADCGGSSRMTVNVASWNGVCSSNSNCGTNTSCTTYTCNNPGTCSSYCSSTTATPVCSSDAGCNDGNSCTTDTCVNSGTCSSYCTHGALPVACSSNAGCDDGNACTTDTCNNPGTCSSYCSHAALPVACSTNAQCGTDTSCTKYTCNNAGTCSSYCSHTTGTPVCNSKADCGTDSSCVKYTCSNAGTCSSSCSHTTDTPACTQNSDCGTNTSCTTYTCNYANTCSSYCSHTTGTPVCNSSTDCNDGNACTTDTCVNAGSCTSYCTHGALPVACSNNTDCNDGNVCTTDVCNNPGTCSSYCSHGALPVACSTNSDCNDGNSCTNDTCINGGTCSSYCTHSAPPINDAGVVQSTSTIDPGPLGNVSQGGCYPGYRTPNYTSNVDLTSVSYVSTTTPPYILLNTVLKNAGYNSIAALDATGCSAGATITTPNFNIYCYVSGNFDAKLGSAIADPSGKTVILYPINNATGTQTVSTLENIPNNRKVIVFVNGDLLVNNNILISAGNTGSGAVFVVNGNVTVNSGITTLDGVYLFSGSFDDGASQTALTGRGSLLSTGVNNILFNRNTATNTNPAEHWIYEPKYLVLFNQALAIPKYTWQELPPQ